MRQQAQQQGQMPRSARPMLQQRRNPEDPADLDDLDRDSDDLDDLDQEPFKDRLLLMWCRLCKFIAKVNRKKKIWRFVGLTSTLVGFITFAITPPFTKLLDHGFLGGFVISIYCALGIGVCCVMLRCRTPRWRMSKSKVLTGQVVFLVLMATSVYSFVVDKMEGDKEKKGWQKVLNLTSCGAFSFMSLSLSRLTDLGFEAGVFNFFLGSFMTAAMSWNWKFAFVAAIFCYILFIMRTNSYSRVEYIPSSDSSDSDTEQGPPRPVRPPPIDVFISFAADDTDDIAKYLDSALSEKSFRVYAETQIDELYKAYDVLLKIREADACIIIFSKSYLNSFRCLHELFYIMHYHRWGRQIVIPIFYKIDHNTIHDFHKSDQLINLCNNTDDVTKDGPNWEHIAYNGDLLHEYIMSGELTWREKVLSDGLTWEERVSESLKEAADMAGPEILGNSPYEEILKNVVNDVLYHCKRLTTRSTAYLGHRHHSQDT